MGKDECAAEKFLKGKMKQSSQHVAEYQMIILFFWNPKKEAKMGTLVFLSAQ